MNKVNKSTMSQLQKTTSIRLKVEHYRYLKESALKNNRSISGQANWLLEMIWYLEETKNEVFMDILNELTEPEYPLAPVKVRRK